MKEVKGLIARAKRYMKSARLLLKTAIMSPRLWALRADGRREGDN